MTPCTSCARNGLTAEVCVARPKCVTCRGVTHLETWGVCEPCIAAVDQQLAELIALHALAGHIAFLAPRTSSDPGPLGARREPPPPVNIDALDLALGEHLLGVLEAWERWWRETLALEAYGKASEARLSRGSPKVDLTPTSVTLHGVVGFLRAWWPQAAQRLEPPPDEFSDEIRNLHRQALAALALSRYDINPDATEPFDWTIRCPRDIDDKGTMCGHRIGMRRRPLPIDGRPPEPLTVNCESCGAHWDTSRLLLVAAAAGTRVEISVDDAMAHWGVSRATVYRMLTRGEAQRGRHGRIALGGNGDKETPVRK